MPENKKKAAVASISNSSLDLRQEIDKLSRLITYARECLENGMTGMNGPSMGYKKDILKSTDAASLQSLATSMEKLVGIKMKYDKHLIDQADNLTPDQEIDALVEFFASQDVASRRKLMRRLVDRHNAMIVGTMYHTVNISIKSDNVD